MTVVDESVRRKVVLQTKSDSDNQKWKRVESYQGLFYMEHPLSGLVLNVNIKRPYDLEVRGKLLKLCNLIVILIMDSRERQVFLILDTDFK